MLEAAMDAVSHPSHSGLRDFGARCLGEFIRYSIKHQRGAGSSMERGTKAIPLRC